MVSQVLYELIVPFAAGYHIVREAGLGRNGHNVRTEIARQPIAMLHDRTYQLNIFYKFKQFNGYLNSKLGLCIQQ